MNNFKNFHFSTKEEEEIKKMPILDRVAIFNERAEIQKEIEDRDNLKWNEDGAGLKS